MKRNTFCILPWIQIHSQNDGRFTPCCIIDIFKDAPNLNSYPDLNSTLNDPLMVSIRNQMLKNEEVEFCKKCYQAEDSGQKSFRETSNEIFQKNQTASLSKTEKTGIIKNPELLSIDLRFSNLCNFKCRTCDASSSTSWYEETNKIMKQHYFNKVIKPFEEENEFNKKLADISSSLKKVYVLGGEPFLNNSFFNFLNFLVQAKRSDIHLSISTNFSTLFFKNQSILDILDNFENISLFISLDSYAERAEYMRKGTDWKSILENFDLLKKHKRIKYFITPVLSVFNIFTFPEFLKTLLDSKIISSYEQVSLSFVTMPQYLSLSVLNESERKIILAKLESIQDDLIRTQLITYIKQLPIPSDISLLRKQFLNYNVTVDRERNERLLKVFPELISLFNGDNNLGDK